LKKKYEELKLIIKMEGYKKKTGEKVFVENYKIPNNLIDPENAEYVALNKETGEEEYVFYKTLERALLIKWPYNVSETGEFVDYYLNGQVKVREKRENKKTIYFATYYENGNIKTKSEEWKNGWAYGNDYYYYPDGKIESIRIRLNGNFGGWKKYYPDGRLKFCEMGNYIIEFYENGKVKKYLEEEEEQKQNYVKYDLTYDEDGVIIKAVFGIENNKYLIYKFNQNTIVDKYIREKYSCEAFLYFIKDGEKVNHSLYNKIYYFNTIKMYKDFLPEVKIPYIDWENYIVDTGIPCMEI
jgi:antitoxin component YwqK of YwqJK toxin-antitoxin module